PVAAAVLLGAVAMRLAALLAAALPRPWLRYPMLAALVVAVAAAGAIPGPEAVARRLQPGVAAAGQYSVIGYAQGDAADAATLDGWRLLRDGWVSPGRPVLDLTSRPALFHVLLGYPPGGRYFDIALAVDDASQHE